MAINLHLAIADPSCSMPPKINVHHFAVPYSAHACSLAYSASRVAGPVADPGADPL